MSKLRITCVTLEMGCGGAQHVMQVLTRHLAEAGHSVSLLLADGGTPDFFEVDHRVHRIEALAPDRSTFPLWDLAGRRRRLQRLRRLILQSRPEVVISFEDFLSVEVLIALRGSNLPVIVCEHMDPLQHRIPRRWRILRRLYYPRADAVVVLNESLRAWSRRIWRPWPSVTIPNPLEPPPPTGPQPDWIGPETVVALGRLVSQKGFDRLIAAFFQIAGRFPAWNLTILGEGPERPRLERQIRECGLASRIQLVGQVANPRRFLPYGGLFVMPSRYEPFGIALVEAMSAGLPVIAFDCPGSPSTIITHEKDGILVPSGSVPDLAASMAALMIDPERRARLGSAATESAQRYSPARIMKLWETLLQQVRPH